MKEISLFYDFSYFGEKFGGGFLSRRAKLVRARLCPAIVMLSLVVPSLTVCTSEQGPPRTPAPAPDLALMLPEPNLGQGKCDKYCYRRRLWEDNKEVW